jgi:hypothetical protein
MEAAKQAQALVGVLNHAGSASSSVGDEVKELPNAEIVAKLDVVQSNLSQKIRAAGQSIEGAAKEAATALEEILTEWTPKQKEAEQVYQKTLRDLKAEGHDAAKFVTYRSQLERLKPKEDELQMRNKTLAQRRKDRGELLSQWDTVKAKDFRELQNAARKVSKRLKDLVRVSVRPSASLDELERVLREHCPGNISQALERLRSQDFVNLTELGAAISEGAPVLIKNYGFSQAAAERIAQGGAKLALEVEECEVQPEAVLELNIGTETVQTWKEVDQLSTGQKATAVLLLLLLESDSPLIVDQPEDDLDNRFIAECIVPTMRDEKRKRQFIFSTHNANIPVLGDAEQIVGLTPVMDDGIERATILEELCGSIDTPKVKELVKVLLEGGQEAFEFRKQKYGF